MEYEIKVRDNYLYIEHEEGKRFVDLLYEVIALIQLLGIKVQFARSKNCFYIDIDYHDMYIELVLGEVSKNGWQFISEMRLSFVHDDSIHNCDYSIKKHLSSGIDEFLVPLEKLKEILIDE